jgi:hypothetical protein
VSDRDGSLLEKLLAADGIRPRNFGWRSTDRPTMSHTAQIGGGDERHDPDAFSLPSTLSSRS